MHAREIIALTDSDGKRASRRRRMEQFRRWEQSGEGPVDGWALAGAEWDEVKCFASRVPVEQEPAVWAAVLDGLDALTDVLVDRFGDVRGWRRDG